MTDLTRLLDQPADTAAGRLEMYARLQALSRWIAARTAEIRDALEADADEIEQLTGGAANVPVAGIGKMLRTAPQPKIRVADETVFAGWFANMWPDAVRFRDTVVVEDDPRAAETVKALHSVLDSGESDGAIADVAIRLANWIRTVRVPLLPDDPTARLTVAGGVVVEPESGEVVPGVTVAQAAPTLQLRVDKVRKQALDEMLAASLPSGGDA